MRLPIFIFVVWILSMVSLPAQVESNFLQNIDQKSSKYTQLANQIWNFAELGYQEYKSSALLQSTLKDEGFTITSGVAEMPTAFIAVYGSGKPIIAILGEYDALPGLSQQVLPEESPVVKGGPGHGCGHNLFGVGSAAAAIAVKEWMIDSKAKGTIRYYGTPAEEGGGGKIYMVRAGLFDDVDAVLHWHPGSGNSADAASSLANKSAKFRFYGVASHASGAPQYGRSALDGVESMNMMTNMMREHITSDSRIHYVITNGGDAPNVVPAFAEVFYYCRHPEMRVVEENFQWLIKCAEGAAIGTQTRMDYEIIHGLYNVLPNETLSKVMYKNLNLIGGYELTPEERAFAEKIQVTLPAPSNLANTNMVSPYKLEERGSGGSTDVGDVSWVVPTAGMRAATFVPGTTNHSWQAVAVGGTSIGTKGMIVAAKTIALTAVELFKNPEVMETAKEELLRRRGSGFIYKPLVGDRKPPLDYRN
ncbi:MAG: M20 family metallopeptidase [Bacteroidota bacterium]|nr:M20 family metallopeptidase [Bacteroidota bacterium]